jgi:hypothetical protein
MNCRFLALIFAGVLLVYPAYGRNKTGLSTEALHGLSTLGLRVEFDGSRQPDAGLTAEQLRSEILVRLHIGKLDVLDGKSWQKHNGDPYLYLNVHSMPVTVHTGTVDFYCYAVSLDLIEKVHLARKPRNVAEACTWSEGYSLIVPFDHLRRVTETVGDLAMEFVKAVKAANPARGPEVGVVP